MNPELALLALRLGLALVLYTFFGAVLLFLWRDLRASARASEIAPAAHLELRTDTASSRGPPEPQKSPRLPTWNSVPTLRAAAGSRFPI